MAEHAADKSKIAELQQRLDRANKAIENASLMLETKHQYPDVARQILSHYRGELDEPLENIEELGGGDDERT